MQTYTPDNWKVVKISSKEHGDVYKVIVSWQGGYAAADLWKISSGFVDLKEFDDRYETHQASGSFYVLYKNYEKESSLIRDKFRDFTEVLKQVSGSIEYIEMKDFKEIFLKK